MQARPRQVCCLQKTRPCRCSLPPRTAEVGDKIPMTLAEDLKIGDTLIGREGSPAVAIVIQVVKTGAGGAPGGITSGPIRSLRAAR